MEIKTVPPSRACATSERSKLSGIGRAIEHVERAYHVERARQPLHRQVELAGREAACPQALGELARGLGTHDLGEVAARVLGDVASARTHVEQTLGRHALEQLAPGRCRQQVHGVSVEQAVRVVAAHEGRGPLGQLGAPPAVRTRPIPGEPGVGRRIARQRSKAGRERGPEPLAATVVAKLVLGARGTQRCTLCVASREPGAHHQLQLMKQHQRQHRDADGGRRETARWRSARRWRGSFWSRTSRW